MKSLILPALVLVVHFGHLILGLPIEGIEETLVIAAQSR